MSGDAKATYRVLKRLFYEFLTVVALLFMLKGITLLGNYLFPTGNIWVQIIENVSSIVALAIYITLAIATLVFQIKRVYREIKKETR